MADTSIRRSLECEQCGTTFNLITGRGRPRRFCSRVCTERANNIRKSAAISALARSQWPTTCANCGSAMEPSYQRTLCSNACKVAVYKARDPQRTRARATRDEAVRRSHYRQGETFDPFEIFERDKWRCHLCGCRTPKRLRGSTDQTAPELDHIIPLSLGGKHTRTNTACCCKACNMRKHNKPLGQMRLIG